MDSGAGAITPCGAAYDNGMKLERIYDGGLIVSNPHGFHKYLTPSVA